MDIKLLTKLKKKLPRRSITLLAEMYDVETSYISQFFKGLHLNRTDILDSAIEIAEERKKVDEKRNRRLKGLVEK